MSNDLFLNEYMPNEIVCICLVRK